MFTLPDEWFYSPRPSPYADTRLLCFPGAGMDASFYASWPEFLPESIEVSSLQLPGRQPVTTQGSSASYQQLSGLIALLSESILRQRRRNQNLIFLGYCLGSFWAYEVARYLREHAGIQPAHLIFTCFPAPHLLTTVTSQMRTVLITQLISSYFPPEHEWHDYLIQRIPLIRQDVDLVEQFTYPLEMPFHCPMTVFGAWQDQLINPQSLWSWKPYTTGNFRVQMFMGDHFFPSSQKKEFLRVLSENILVNGVKYV